MQQDIIFDVELIHRYDKAGPRYTSYPTAVQFHEGFNADDYKQHALRTNTEGNPLSLYFHIPFCDTVCYYCGCNKVVTKDRSRALPYLERLHREVALQAELFSRERPVTQLHLGGGTPTFLSHSEMRQLIAVTKQHFQLLDNDQGEYSIEIDPREADAKTVAMLRELGFNRMSLGVQDFEPKVQQAVNRIQTEAETFNVLEAARGEGFRSISIDLIYGLPHQTVSSFLRTLDKILKVMPERLSVFNYAHLPTLFKPQRRINPEELPNPMEKLAILQAMIQHLTDAGYVYIGMDHFARPDDELVVAQRNGSLYRNFQGYATHADCDLIGLGATSIGKIGNTYSQNVKTLEEYYALIDAGKLPIFRGVALTEDDVLRRAVITQLICNFTLDIKRVECEFKINFKEYFKEEWDALELMEADGLLVRINDEIEVLPAGRLLVRNICMVFDAYLRKESTQRYSKVI